VRSFLKILVTKYIFQDAVEMEIGPKLIHTLKAAENHSIPYGVIRGEARPVKRTEVIKSPYVSDVIGLIQRIKTREHKSEWSRTTRLWYVKCLVRTLTMNSLPIRI